jgi:hypothetical protein
MEKDDEIVATALRALAEQPLPNAPPPSSAIWRLAQVRRAIATQTRTSASFDIAVSLSVAVAATAAAILAWSGAGAEHVAFTAVGVTCLAAAAGALTMLWLALREGLSYPNASPL